ncbi:MAG: putative Fe-S cluster assembly protein SufT [Myxococcales bacterium]|nr:putative Fe-S cluster assembly protein SufT [Myxococcales bacterium]USN50369.1 MAG: putative Fe-S cluster assembly protein SufT [Myxococcales bacterium]
MHRLTGTEVELVRTVSSILIPDGIESSISKGDKVYIQHVLGGMFTVQTDQGYLMRVDGKDADALGQPIPDERRDISLQEVKEKGIEACVKEQLKTCYDPEIPVNIVDLGLIYESEIKCVDNDNEHFIVRIEMTLTAPGCGMGEIIKSDVEKKIRDIPGVVDVVVDLMFDPPWESSLMSEAAKLQLGFL